MYRVRVAKQIDITKLDYTTVTLRLEQNQPLKYDFLFLADFILNACYTTGENCPKFLNNILSWVGNRCNTMSDKWIYYTSKEVIRTSSLLLLLLFLFQTESKFNFILGLCCSTVKMSMPVSQLLCQHCMRC